jgi:hypothetical protein
VLGGCAHERVDVRVTADNAVQHHEIVCLDRIAFADEVGDVPVDAVGEAAFGEQRGRRFFVAAGELDVRCPLSPCCEQLELNRTDARRVRATSCRGPAAGSGVRRVTRTFG